MLKKELQKQGDFLFRYRSNFPLLFLAAGMAVFVNKTLHLTESGTVFPKTNYMIICLAVSLFGQLIRILTVGFTPANTSGRNSLKQIAEEINTTGIYSTVRHPLYIGNFFIWLGLAMITANLWFVVAFVFLYWIYYERIMYSEELFLYNKFGEDYKNWADETPAFIPALKKFQKPSLPFSWKKILKKEKNGIAAIFILFFLFDFISNNLETGQFKFKLDFNFWFYAAAVATVFYFILKYMKWHTTLLDEPGR